MLNGKGFKNAINLSGGFRSWEGEKGEAAFFEENRGLELFTGKEGPEETLVVAYSLEEGLRQFYFSMAENVNSTEAKKLFQKLSQIEVKHQDRIFDQYVKISGKTIIREQFETELVNGLEGGLTTEEYANSFQPDWESVEDIIQVAMSIEAQALDLYMRASGQTVNEKSGKALLQIADEERSHLKQLGSLLDSLMIERT